MARLDDSEALEDEAQQTSLAASTLVLSRCHSTIARCILLQIPAIKLLDSRDFNFFIKDQENKFIDKIRWKASEDNKLLFKILVIAFSFTV